MPPFAIVVVQEHREAHHGLDDRLRDARLRWDCARENLGRNIHRVRRAMGANDAKPDEQFWAKVEDRARDANDVMFGLIYRLFIKAKTEAANAAAALADVDPEFDADRWIPGHRPTPDA
jgi:hypothetical protein